MWSTKNAIVPFNILLYGISHDEKKSNQCCNKIHGYLPCETQSGVWLPDNPCTWLKILNQDFYKIGNCVCFAVPLYDNLILYNGKFWRGKTLANLVICYEFAKVFFAKCNLAYYSPKFSPAKIFRYMVVSKDMQENPGAYSHQICRYEGD